VAPPRPAGSYYEPVGAGDGGWVAGADGGADDGGADDGGAEDGGADVGGWVVGLELGVDVVGLELGVDVVGVGLADVDADGLADPEADVYADGLADALAGEVVLLCGDADGPPRPVAAADAGAFAADVCAAGWVCSCVGVCPANEVRASAVAPDATNTRPVTQASTIGRSKRCRDRLGPSGGADPPAGWT
jgi:hypothetical protein